MQSGMRLDVGHFRVHAAAFGERTKLQSGFLTINRGELRELLLTDRAFADVEISIAQPGDSTRIHNIVDVVEPRVRIGQPGSDFPGMLCPPQTVGDGVTYRLAGTSVVEVSEPVPGEQAYWRTAIVDMDGENARLSPMGSLVNIVVRFTPKGSFETHAAREKWRNVLVGSAEAVEYGLRVRLAGMRAAVYLASAAKGQAPDKVTCFQLAKSVSGSNVPVVVYLCDASGGLYTYGKPLDSLKDGVPEPLPVVMHPNEVLDGAVVNLEAWPACHRDITYLYQNHPIIKELYRRQATEIVFGGMILYTSGRTREAKERVSAYSANLARLLSAEGAILSYLGSGHSLVDVMLVCRKLEHLGVSTTILAPEMAAGSDQSGLVYVVPEATAMVSTGNYEYSVCFPGVQTVLGGDVIAESGDRAGGPFTLPVRTVLAATDPFGVCKMRGT